MTIYKENFASINEFLRAVEHRPYNHKTSRSSTEDGNKSFRGTESYAEANKLLQYGDIEIAAQIKKERAKVFTQYTSIKRLPYNDLQGFAPIIPLFLQGIPQCMVNVKNVPVKSKIVTIYYSPAYSSRYRCAQGVQAGIHVLNMLQQLELSGYRVNLFLTFGISEHNDMKRGNKFILNIKVKDSMQPLNIKKLAYPIAHPSMLRRHVLCYVDTIPDERLTGYLSAYGYPLEVLGNENARSIYRQGVCKSDDILIFFNEALNNDNLLRDFIK